MEKVLDIYERAYDEEYPVVCFDERPCFLIGDKVEPLKMETSKVKREDYHYSKHGSCNVLAAIEPLTGNRLFKVTDTRTKHDYALFMNELVSMFPKAKKIILVQDNLNTHNPSSFYDNYSAEKAFELSEKFHMIYTPPKASWLNMAEIEFSALSRQCLNRRIHDKNILEKEVIAWVNDRIKQSIIINWHFTKNHARNTFKKYYSNLTF